MKSSVVAADQSTTGQPPVIECNIKGHSHQKVRVAVMIELVLKRFYGISLAYVRSLEGSQKASWSVV